MNSVESKIKGKDEEMDILKLTVDRDFAQE
jgi:hypothetical protein